VRRRSAAKKTSRKPVPNKVQNVLWARAAGRCQYAGCNKLLIGEQISGARNANKSYIAHIVGDSPEGPRGDATLSAKLAHDPDNLMLVCDEHHRVIDREMVDAHSVDVLREMKRRHEDRIRVVTGIDEDLGSHVIRYAAKIGANESPVAKSDLKWSMIPQRYPLDDGWIDLDLATLDLRDDDPNYWPTHIRNLRSVFGEKVRGRMGRQEIRRIAVFGLAPMPLLFELGRLISDIATADVRQLPPRSKRLEVGSVGGAGRVRRASPGSHRRRGRAEARNQRSRRRRTRPFGARPRSGDLVDRGGWRAQRYCAPS
jgi:hypothetical protein